MLRTQIQLNEDQYRRLKALAAERGVSIAELVREGVEVVLHRADAVRRWQRLWSVVGSSQDREDQNDVAEHHDAFLQRIREDDLGLR